MAGIATIAVGRATTPRASTSEPARERREELLARLARRVVPAADGGWVLATPAAGPEPERRLLAAAVLATDPRAGATVGPADIAPAARGLAGPDERRSALALAQVLATPPASTAVPDATAAEVERRTSAGLDRGDGAWLAPLLHLVRAPGPAGERARRRIVTYAPSASCADLPGSGERLPPPGGELVVLLRVLVARSAPCPEAEGLLRRALRDGAWSAPIAVDELADLVVLGGAPTGDVADELDRRLADWTDAPDATTDPAVLLLARRARRVASLPAPLPRSVALRLRVQVQADGRLPDRSSAPTSPVDVAILRQLVEEDLLPRWVLQEAIRAASAAPLAPGGEAIHALLVERRAPTCAAVPSTIGRAASIVRVVDRAIHEVVAARCADDVDLEVLLAGASSDAGADATLPAWWATIVTACVVSPEAISDRMAVTPPIDGPFADDALWLAAAAALADPVAACTADRS